MKIEDPRTNTVAFVTNENRLQTQSVGRVESVSEAIRGDAYNINSGIVSLTSTAAHGVLYIKNQEAKPMIVESIAVGLDNTAATVTGSAVVRMIANPTSVSFSDTSTVIRANRNFSTTKALTTSTLIYNGAQGATVTGGVSSYLFYHQQGRLFADLGSVLGIGNSLAVTVDPKVTSGTSIVYVALVCYLLIEE